MVSPTLGNVLPSPALIRSTRTERAILLEVKERARAGRRDRVRNDIFGWREKGEVRNALLEFCFKSPVESSIEVVRRGEMDEANRMR